MRQKQQAGRRIVRQNEIEVPNYYQQLCEAARYGDAVTVKRLLEHGVGPDKPVFFVSPALLSAVGYGEEEIVRLLIDAHADVNAGCDFDFTPLMSACCYGIGGRPELVKLLLERGANVHSVDFHGHTALHYALQANNTECVHLLRAASGEAQAGQEEQMLRASMEGQE